MKNTELNINGNPILSGVPVEPEYEEPWRKVCYTCTGSGRFEKKFDLRHLNFIADVPAADA